MKRLSRQDGMGLIPLLGLIAGLAVGASGLVMLLSNSMAATSSDSSRTKAFNVAEGALNVGMATLQSRSPKSAATPPAFPDGHVPHPVPDGIIPEPGQRQLLHHRGVLRQHQHERGGSSHPRRPPATTRAGRAQTPRRTTRCTSERRPESAARAPPPYKAWSRGPSGIRRFHAGSRSTPAPRSSLMVAGTASTTSRRSKWRGLRRRRRRTRTPWRVCTPRAGSLCRVGGRKPIQWRSSTRTGRL